MNEIIQELSKYSQKELENILNKKNVFSSRYLLINNKLDILLGRDTDGQFRTKNYGRFTAEYLKDNCSPLTTKQYAEIKLNALANKINNWDGETFVSWCKKQFIDVYGEEYVDFQDRTVVVWFPEITITNSVEQSHLMRDVYLRFQIYGGGEAHLTHLNRGTVTEREYRNNYQFSHCNTSSVYDWCNSFCFGDTPIKDLRYNLKNRDKLFVFKNLKFFLESLKEYLSWESLEGVPYNKIDNVINDSNRWYRSNYEISKNDLETVYNTAISKMSSFKYDFNSDNVYLTDSSVSMLAEILTQEFPQHSTYYLNGNSVEEYNTNGGYYCPSEHIEFKGEWRSFRVIKEEEEEITLPKRIHNNVLNQVVDKIDQEFTKFYINKKLNDYNS